MTENNLDPETLNPRELMQQMLPAARAEFIKAWEFLADPQTPLERRRLARTRAASIADDHKTVVEFLRAQERKHKGDDLLNLRHLATELERHSEALLRLSTISLIGLSEAKDLRPEALGCGRRYRDPAKTDQNTPSRADIKGKPKLRDKDKDRKERDRPRKDRGPKVPKSALGTSKHESTLGADLDDETRSKLEAMRAALEQQ